MLSKCKRYRYALSRVWAPDKDICMFIMLNPSTADANADDPTIRRCINFAGQWGYGGIYVANLFAIRGVNPKEALSVQDPVGPRNDLWIEKMAARAKLHIAAWGSHAAGRKRGAAVRKILAPIELKCLGLTKDGYPRHPLYLRKDCHPINWE